MVARYLNSTIARGDKQRCNYDFGERQNEEVRDRRSRHTPPNRRFQRVSRTGRGAFRHSCDEHAG